MSTDPSQTVPSARQDDHDQAWRRIDAGQPAREWRIDVIPVTALGRVSLMSDERDESEAAIEQRLRSADEREQALDDRESQIKAWESRQAERRGEVESVLTDAAHRDEVALARDWAAAKRDMAANMQAWLTGNEGRADAEARQEALDDRLHSEADRAASVSVHPGRGRLRGRRDVARDARAICGRAGPRHRMRLPACGQRMARPPEHGRDGRPRPPVLSRQRWGPLSRATIPPASFREPRSHPL